MALSVWISGLLMQMRVLSFDYFQIILEILSSNIPLICVILRVTRNHAHISFRIVFRTHANVGKVFARDIRSHLRKARPSILPKFAHIVTPCRFFQV